MFFYYIRTYSIVLCCERCYVIKSMNLIFVGSQYNASITHLPAHMLFHFQGAMEEGIPVQAHPGLHNMIRFSAIRDNNKIFLC